MRNGMGILRIFSPFWQAVANVKVGTSKAPVRSASMGPQSSKGAAAMGGTRQGRWSFKNQVRCETIKEDG